MEWTPEEQAEHRKLWVEALRSGKYKQGIEHLKSEKGFCCLGVACDISGLGNWGQEFYPIYVTSEDYSRNDVLPDSVRKWLGLGTADGWYAAGSLTEDNDGGKSFLAIANIIEASPELIDHSAINTY